MWSNQQTNKMGGGGGGLSCKTYQREVTLVHLLFKSSFTVFLCKCVYACIVFYMCMCSGMNICVCVCFRWRMWWLRCPFPSLCWTWPWLPTKGSTPLTLCQSWWPGMWARSTQPSCQASKEMCVCVSCCFTYVCSLCVCVCVCAWAYVECVMCVMFMLFTASLA